MSERDAMTRCIKCNTVLVDVHKESVESFVPEFVFHRYSAFKLAHPATRSTGRAPMSSA